MPCLECLKYPCILCFVLCCSNYGHHSSQQAKPSLRCIDLHSRYVITILSLILDVSLIVCQKLAPQYDLVSDQNARDYSASKFLHMSGYSTSNMRETRPLLGKENII